MTPTFEAGAATATSPGLTVAYRGLLSQLRQCWDEDVEHEANRIADEATKVLDRLTNEAARVLPGDGPIPGAPRCRRTTPSRRTT